MADTQATLPDENTDAGAMARLFLLETRGPDDHGFDRDESLNAMRLMRQTIDNRLKSPSQYGAPGATTETEIMALGNQLAGFGDYPKLSAPLRSKLELILMHARGGWRSQKAYAQFVADAVTAAGEAAPPTDLRRSDVTGWRTAGSGSPARDSGWWRPFRGTSSPRPRRCRRCRRATNAGNTVVRRGKPVAPPARRRYTPALVSAPGL